jgi:phosphoglycolate phosphatase-like HAD superfamily hydrolase
MIENIIFDFDGVILESNDIKIEGFKKLFSEFGLEKSDKISDHFRNNAGLSRYDIIAFFFEYFTDQKINEQILKSYAKKYSDIIMDEMKRVRFVSGADNFIVENFNKYKYFIVSSSDQIDLKEICSDRKIEKYFMDIKGSPVKKTVNLAELIKIYQLDLDNTVYIGDSYNDYKACLDNNLRFIARKSGVFDWSSFKELYVINDLNEIQSILGELK